MIRPGEEWSRPVVGAPDVEVEGMTRRSPARCTPRRRGPSCASSRARRPTSRVAVALSGAPDGSVEVALDALDLGDGTLATNLAIVGTAPDRLSRFTRSVPVEVVVDGVSCFSGPATTVVVAVGQFLRGADLVPRGHPGDGRAEVQVYAVAGRDRRRLRARLATGRSRAAPRDHATIGSSRSRSAAAGRWRGRPTAWPTRPATASPSRSFRRGTAWCSSPPRRRGDASLPSLFPCCTRRSRSARRSRHPPAVFHEPRRARVRVDEPARGREGRVVRALLAFRQESAPAVPRRVRRRPRSHRRPHGRRDGRPEARRRALRARVLRIRRRLRRAARRRAPRVRAGVEPPHEGARVGPADGLPRTVDALHPVRLAPPRPLPLLAPVRGVRVAARHAVRRRPRRAVRHVQRAAARR